MYEYQNLSDTLYGLNIVFAYAFRFKSILRKLDVNIDAFFHTPCFQRWAFIEIIYRR